MKLAAGFNNLTIVDHPLVASKLSSMRDKTTPSPVFAARLRELSHLMAFAVTSQLPLKLQSIETPICSMDAPVLAEPQSPVIVPILRAGDGMLDGLRAILPDAATGHIGVYRDHETHEPKEYLVRLPKLEGRSIFLVDPMLATGHSAIHAVKVLLDHGAAMDKITFMCLVAAPEGVRAFEQACPKISIYTAALDSHLNENAYIVPGLGDAGDRIFGTEPH